MRRLPDAAAARARLLGAYLDVWTDHEPGPRLQQAGTLAQALGALHQAISFQHILAGLEA